MGISSNPEARARQLSNLRGQGSKPSPAAPRGNQYGRSHGGYGRLAAAQVDEKVGELMLALGDDLPVRESDGSVPRADAVVLRLLAESLIRLELWQAAQQRTDAGSRFSPSRPGRRPRRHLFVNGHLRCAGCGRAMQTRSGKTPEQDQYVCATHRMQVQRDGDVSPCSTGWHKRQDVDGEFLALFERQFLDYEATRERVASELSQKLATAKAEAASAERELAKVEEQRAKLDGDYLAGRLGAATFERLSSSLDDQHRGALAARDRLVANADTVYADLVDLDAESETLRRLAGIRDVVASHLTEADSDTDIGVLRGVIATAFEAVFLSPAGDIAGMKAGSRIKAAAGVGGTVVVTHLPGGPSAFLIDGEPDADGTVSATPVDLPRFALPLAQTARSNAGPDAAGPPDAPITSVHGHSNGKVGSLTL